MVLKVVIGLLAVVLAGVAPAIVFGALSYSGFCYADSRRRPDEERIRLALEHEILIYQGAVPPPGAYGLRPADAAPVAPYRDVDELLALNPNCCWVANTGREGFPRGAANALAGDTAAFVHMQYAVRYLDPEDGVVRSVLRTNVVAISNCGEVWSGMRR